MKKIIQKEIIEEICDVCRKPAQNIDACVTFNFSYESQELDMQSGRLDFCPQCASDFLNIVREKYPFFCLKNNDGM